MKNVSAIAVNPLSARKMTSFGLRLPEVTQLHKEHGSQRLLGIQDRKNDKFS